MKELKQAQIDALAIEIFNEFNGQKEGITMQEAQEMAKMELNEKQMRRYEKSDTPKKKTTKVKKRKIDQDKAVLIDILTDAIIDNEILVTAQKNEAEFSLEYKDNSYTVKLIKHRQSK